MYVQLEHLASPPNRTRCRRIAATDSSYMRRTRVSVLPLSNHCLSRYSYRESARAPVAGVSGLLPARVKAGSIPPRARAQSEFRRRKVSGRRRDEGRVQPAREVCGPRHLPQVAHHALGDDLESRVARVPRKHPELELKRRHLGNRRCALAPRGVVARTRAQANGAEGQARRSLEREEELGRWLGNGRV